MKKQVYIERTVEKTVRDRLKRRQRLLSFCKTCGHSVRSLARHNRRKHG